MEKKTKKKTTDNETSKKKEDYKEDTQRTCDCFTLINIFMSAEYLKRHLLKRMYDVCLGLQIWNLMNLIIRSFQRWQLSKEQILNASPLQTSTDYS